MSNLHIPFHELGDPEKIVNYKTQVLEALHLTPENPDLYIIYASILLQEGKFEEALQLTRIGIGFNPNFMGHYVTLAACYQALNRDQDAFDVLWKAYKKVSDVPAINWNLSLMLLQRGEWELGWNLYRWRKIHLPGFQRSIIPESSMSHTFGKRILVWAEQGLGDIVMMFRYVKLLKTEFGFEEVVLEVPEELYLLFCRHLEDVDGIYIRQADFHSEYDFDCHCCIMELPYILKSKQPSNEPYLTPSIMYSEQWAKTIEENELKGLNIGICWHGSLGHKNNKRRSAALNHFEPLGKLGNIFAIQKDRHDTPDFDIPAGLKGMLNPGEGMINADFTSGLLANMDYIVTIDSFIAHLSGALGIKTYLILPFNQEWRWQTGIGTSIWYESVTMLKQDTPNDWDGVMTKVIAHIEQDEINKKLSTK